MAIKFAMEYTILLWLFGLYSTSESHATTHWMVTETGLVQPRVETPFEMARPYDLLAFLNQDTRWENIKKLYVKLSKRQLMINELWKDLVKECDINTHLGLDRNCVKAGLLSELNWYEGFMEEGLSKHIPEEEFFLYTPQIFDGTPHVPDCKKTFSLTFSMFAYDHLESMKNLSDLNINSEMSLPELVSPLMTVEQFGQWLHRVLSLNDTSWVHYNMASLFWRIQGNAPKAIECSRRAIYFSPREHKDVALLSLGTILHRAKKSQDAIVILKAAVDHDPFNIYANFVLANAYAITGEFDLSLKYFEKTLYLNPAFEQAEKNKYGLLCQQELIKKMIVINKKLQALRVDISKFISNEDLWLQIQAHFLKTRKDSDELDYRRVDNIVAKMTELMGINMKDLKKEGDKNAVIQYFLNGPLYSDKWIAERGVQIIDAAFSIQRLVKHIEKQGHITSEEVFQPDLVNVSNTPLQKELGPLPAVPLGRRNHLLCGNTQPESAPLPDSQQKPVSTKSKPVEVDELEEYKVGPPLYPNNVQASRNINDFDRDTSWPTQEVCKNFVPVDNTLTIYPVFLPFENKGLSVKGILTDKIGVSADVEQDLPWHPPTCPNAKEAAAALKKTQKGPHVVLEVLSTEPLLQKLRSYVTSDLSRAEHMQDAEIGQRIYMAIQNNVAPKWMLFTLASLYWRSRNNNVNALNCLLSASRRLRNTKLKDIIYTSMASVYMEMGYIDEAFKVAEEAYKIAMYEPPTNFMLFQINMVKRNRHSQMFHLKQVVRIESGFMSNVARNLLINWACSLKHAATMHHYHFQQELEDANTMETGCTDGARAQTRSHADDAHSHKDTKRTSSISPKSTLGKLMRLTDDGLEPEAIGRDIFDMFIGNTPPDPADKEGHAENMKYVMELVQSLHGCGKDGCHSMTRERLEMREEECLFQYVQMQHWPQIISGQYLIAGDPKLISEVTATRPVTKLIPDCRLYDDPEDNYFIEQILKTDIDGWEPRVFWKMHMSEYFEFNDFDTLGAKLAAYVDEKPRWWWGLLAAGWWCGVAGRGACAVRCAAAAHAAAPPHARTHPIVTLTTLLHKQYKPQEGVRLAYLGFYLAPKSRLEAFILGVAFTYTVRFDAAIWMYRYALMFDDSFLPSKACVHATMCLQLYPDKSMPVDQLSEVGIDNIQEAIRKQHEGLWSFF